MARGIFLAASCVLPLLLGAAVAQEDACRDAHKDEASCKADKNTAGGCVWCTAGAVPPGCFTKENAKKLPPSVFDCDFGTVAAAEASDSSLTDEEVMVAFNKFKAAHGKSYSAREEAARLANFRRSLDKVQAHNQQPGRTFDMGINAFSDMSDEEFEEKVLMEPQECSATTHKATPGASHRAPPGADLPSFVDWREKGVISEVKNQGHCGSCWTFSSTGCLEAHLAIKYDNWRAPRLSEQQLVDCAQAFDNHGCSGGLPSHAFQYIQDAGGLSTEFHYPYKGQDGTCAFQASDKGFIGVKVPGGSVNLTVGDEDALKFTLANRGPVSIAFQVSGDFRHYSSGVYTSTECKNGKMDVNHAVLAVGYGTTADAQPYWTVKNSWGYEWGDMGFFKIEAYKNMCGVADCMSYPNLWTTQDEHSPVVV